MVEIRSEQHARWPADQLIATVAEKLAHRRIGHTDLPFFVRLHDTVRHRVEQRGEFGGTLDDTPLELHFEPLAFRDVSQNDSESRVPVDHELRDRCFRRKLAAILAKAGNFLTFAHPLRRGA